MSEYGWIKLHRELLCHPIWLNSSPEQKVILVALICMANHAPNKWEWNGELFHVERGQMVTSLDSIVSACGKGVTIRNVRTALNRFEKLGFLTNKSTNRGRLITIEKYGKWQDEHFETDKQTDRQLTGKRQAPDIPLTPNKNVKNEKNKYIVEIVSHLNEVCGTNYRPDTKKTVSLISARMREGYSLDDFIKVIDIKAAEWLKDEKMKKHLCPNTLFCSEHFETYKNQAEMGSSKPQRKATSHEEIEAMKKAEGAVK